MDFRQTGWACALWFVFERIEAKYYAAKLRRTS